MKKIEELDYHDKLQILVQFDICKRMKGLNELFKDMSEMRILHVSLLHL